MRLRFIIPGRPQGKQRPRVAPGQSRPYTPKETVEYERKILAIFRQKFPDHKPFAGPVMLRMTAVFETPKGFKAALQHEAAAGRLYCTRKPDIDNLCKIALDSLNGVAWLDDAQVQGGGVKRYGSPERIEVDLEFIEGHPVVPSEERRRAKQQSQFDLTRRRR